MRQAKDKRTCYVGISESNEISIISKHSSGGILGNRFETSEEIKTDLSRIMSSDYF